MELNGQLGMELTQEPVKCDDMEVAKVGNNRDNYSCNCLHPNLHGPTLCVFIPKYNYLNRGRCDCK